MKKVLIIILIIIAGFIIWKKEPWVKTFPDTNPVSCVDEVEGTPVITSLSAYSGSIGTEFEIKGCNFNGFEGDLFAWIENSKGERGLLGTGVGSTAKLIKATLKSPTCQFDNSYSGKDCTAFLTITPGQYKIFVNPWGKESNKVGFIVNENLNADLMKVKIYLPREGSEQLECNDVAAVERIVPKTEKVATAALEELLKSFPAGSKLNSLVIVNGEARADFNAVTESGGGSCGMGVRTAQIYQTLLQFPTIKTIKLSIDGRTQDIFQP